MAGMGEGGNRGMRTPRAELSRWRALRERDRARVPERIMVAMLEACGNLGYRRVSVQSVIDRCNVNRGQFYSHFASKADCYAAAYEFEVDRVFAVMHDAWRSEPSWAHALVTALRRFAENVESNVPLARGVLVEVHVAGGRALRKRSEMLERLACAIDKAREHSHVRHSPPPITASLMLGAVEAFVTSLLLRGTPHEFEEGLRELAQMIMSAYLGEEAAEAELELVLAA